MKVVFSLLKFKIVMGDKTADIIKLTSTHLHI